jgi:hypothetical protein
VAALSLVQNTNTFNFVQNVNVNINIQAGPWRTKTVLHRALD